jgi:hypothetical protein
MPLLFYFPMIIWAGLCEVAREDMRRPIKDKSQS